MQKPAEWDNVQAQTGGFERLPAGGYVCKIIKADVTLSKAGKEMMRLAVDIAAGDHKDYFRKQFDSRHQQNTEAKWPCMYYQLTEGDSMGRFKGMLVNIEESNPGYKWDWNETSLAGKQFGGVFREEQYLNNNNQARMSTKLWSVRPVEDIESVEVPEPKMLDQQAQYGGAASTFGPAGPDEEIPF